MNLMGNMSISNKGNNNINYRKKILEKKVLN